MSILNIIYVNWHGKFQNLPIMKHGFPTTNSHRNSITNKGEARRKRREKGKEWKGETKKKGNNAPHYFYTQY